MDNIILETLSILLYGTMSQVEYYIETRCQDKINSNNNDFEERKSVKGLCDMRNHEDFGYTQCFCSAYSVSEIL